MNIVPDFEIPKHQLVYVFVYIYKYNIRDYLVFIYTQAKDQDLVYQVE